MLTGGTLNLQTVGMANHSENAMYLSGTTLTGSKLSLVNNRNACAMVFSSADVTIADLRANNNNSGAIYQNGGVMTLSSATFSGNYAYYSGGAIYQNGGVMVLSSATFSGNSARGAGGAICQYGGVMTLSSATYSGNSASSGGAVYMANALVNMENTDFSSNKGSGGAMNLVRTTLNYVVTSGAKVTNIGNTGTGGWLYVYDQSTVNITIEEEGLLTVGDTSGQDSIAGTSNCQITKNGTGYMLMNGDIGSYSGQWNITAGTLELARIARKINLDNWTIGTDATLVLSVKNDTINMNMSKKIGTIDMGGGSDTINTSGYDLTEGTILLSDLAIGGGGRVSVNLRNRSTTEGSTLRLNGIYLDSEFTGNDYTDTILINAESQLIKAIDLGNGDNEISGTALATFKSTVKMGAGNDTLSFTNVTMEDTLNMGDGNNTLYIWDTGSLQDVIEYNVCKSVCQEAYTCFYDRFL